MELAKKYQKTQNQILLNWVISKGFYPLVKSENIDHIDENLAAPDFAIEAIDLECLNNFKFEGYVSPKIDWFMVGDGTRIHAVPNEFDEKYPVT